MSFSKIILIDDDDIVSYSFKRLLKGFFPQQQFTTCKHGGEGLDYLNNLEREKSNGEILILLDLNMPLMDGWSFLKKYREQALTIKKNITIYVFSSTIDRNEIKAIQENPLISGIITKPLTLDELNELIL